MLHHLARRLAARGHRLELLAFDLDRDADDIEIKSDAFIEAQAIPERRRSGLDYLLRLLHPFPNSAGECWNPDMWRAIQGRLEAVRFDLVHFFGGIQVYEFRNLVLDRMPTVIVPYDSMSLLLERDLATADGPVERISAWAKLVMARCFERRMYRGFGRVVTVSGVDQSVLHGLDPRLATAVIPNGVECDAAAAARVESSRNSIVFVGNYAYRPNLDAAEKLIREILPRLQKRVPQVRLLLVGANPPARLRTQASPNIEITGFVSDVSSYLRDATCFVSPLRSGAGMRNKILEAMAEGLPVVATSRSLEGLAIMPGEHALLGSTPGELAESALRLLVDRRLRNRIGQAGRRLVCERYSWESVADRYEQLYKAVISEFQHGQDRVTP